MIDLGVGSGLKSQQDSLGCVSASLKQPKVVSFMNFLRDSKKIKVAVTLALASGEVLSGSKTADVEVSSIDFVVLDCTYDFIGLDCSYNCVALDCSYDSFLCTKSVLFLDL